MPERYSFETGQKRPLEIIDYILFSLLFVVSAGIGFYHAYRGRNKTTEDEFNFAGRSLHTIPVGISIAATFFSAITILGIPAEVYTNNSMFLWTLGANLIATIFVAHLFAPFFHRLKMTSCYEYIEKRYCRNLRLLASSLFLVQYLLVIGVVLYLPCLALQAVTGMSLWYTMVVVCVVCTLYTMLGGMRSVVWVDTLQFGVIVTGLMIALTYGISATGGFTKAWDIAASRGRIQFTDTSFDLRSRHTVWGLTFGMSVYYTYVLGMVQVQIQRICTLSNARKAAVAIWVNFTLFVVIQSLVCIIGIVMYAFYSDCHPVTYGLVEKSDQLIPLFILDVTGQIPGLPGVFLACIFSGSLSTISSCLSTLSTVIVEDFIKPFCCYKVVANHGVAVIRGLVFCLGCLQLILAVLISEMSALIFQAITSLQGMLVGPLMGLFLCGIFLPWTNSKGATAGLLTSLAFMLWLVLGTLFEKPEGIKPLPTYTSGCNWNVSSHMAANVTQISAINTQWSIINTTFSTQEVHPVTEEPLIHNFYKISYVWYSGLGASINVLVTLVVSFMTGFTKPSTIDSRLICPILDHLCPWLPEKMRRPFRFGFISTEVRENKDEDDELTKQQETSLLDNRE